jgi:hypothetical protein
MTGEEDIVCFEPAKITHIKEDIKKISVKLATGIVKGTRPEGN